MNEALAQVSCNFTLYAEKECALMEMFRVKGAKYSCLLTDYLLRPCTGLFLGVRSKVKFSNTLLPVDLKSEMKFIFHPL